MCNIYLYLCVIIW